jgi:FMN-dependent NADH-azoreductase
MAQLQMPYMDLGIRSSSLQDVASCNVKNGKGQMMNILHVSCSPRGKNSESHRLSKKILGFLLERNPTAVVIDRAIGGGAVPPVDEDYAISQQSAEDVSQAGSAALSDGLIRELEISDFVIIGTPVHNFTLPSTLKAWIDHIARVRRTFDVTSGGKVGKLRDRPIFIAVSSGGRYSGEDAHQPDFLTPYLKAVFGMLGLRDLTFFSVEGTAFGRDAVAAARSKTEQALRSYFASNRPVPHGLDQ